MKQFLKIVITTPDVWPDEPQCIADLLDTGIDYLHLRKPEWNEMAMRHLIESIHPRYYSRIRIHSHFTLVDEYGLAGPHLNHRWPEYTGVTGTITRSCHSVDELSMPPQVEYQTLSPVYDSISKHGYHSSFILKDIMTQIRGKNVIAMGGVTPDRFEELASYGFAGAAMLGCIWKQ